MAGDNDVYSQLAEGELPPCLITIDREGDWYHRGSLMHREDIVSHLCRHLCRDEASGLYIIKLEKERCYLEVEDTPLVITRVAHRGGEAGAAGPEQLLLSIKHLEGIEPLDPGTLRVGPENVLYCTVRPEGLPARFLRPAYYQLAEFIQEDREQGGFYLLLGGERHYVCLTCEAPAGDD
jgi:hypothetical protein